MNPLPFIRAGLILFAGWTCAQAAIHRMGLFVGIDQGLENETTLKFASLDANEMASLFRQSGLYGPEGISLLSNVSMEDIRRAMKAVETSALRYQRQGDQVYLIVYFSGHGDAQSLHIRGSKLMR